MSRRTSADNSEWRVPVQTNTNLTGNSTVATLGRRRATNTAGNWQAMWGCTDSSGATMYAGEFDGSNRVELNRNNGANPVTSTATFTNTTDYITWVVTRATGTTTPRLHYKNWTTGAAWVHQNFSGTFANPPSQTGGSIRWGEWSDNDDANMNYTACAVWNANLSDADVELLTLDIGTWVAHTTAPQFVHQHNQASNTVDIDDLMTNGYTVTGTISGTTDTNGIAGTSMDATADPGGITFYTPGGTPITVSEAITLSEAIDIVRSSAVTDSVTLSESTTGLSALLALIESITVSDSMGAPTASLSLTDSTALGELLTSAGAMSLTDSWALSELLTMSGAMSLTDTFTATDSLVVTIPKDLTDSFTVTDALAILATTSIPLTDSLALTDGTPAIAASLGIADSWALSESITNGQETQVSVTDSATQSEGTTALSALLVVNDAITAAEVLSIAASVALNDSLTLTDVFSGIALSLTDTSTLSEAVAVLAAVGITDTLVVTDSSVLTMTQFLSIVDSLSVTDAAAVQATLALALSDSLTLADSVVVLTGVLPPSIKLPTTVSLPVWAASAVIASRLSHVTIPAHTTTVEVPEYVSEVDLG